MFRKRWLCILSAAFIMCTLFAGLGPIPANAAAGPNTVYIFDLANYLRTSNKCAYPLNSDDSYPKARYVKISVTTPNNYAADYTTRIPEIEIYNNIAVGMPASATISSSPCGEPEHAVDGRTDTQWFSTSKGATWLNVDLGSQKTIVRWVVRHAQSGGEPASYNTRNFKLQVSDDGKEYTDADTVSNNTSGVTERTINGVTGRYFRLFITKPNQLNGNQTARICEFELYDQDNLLRGANAESSSRNSSTETANEAIDGNLNTHWCSNGASDSAPWITFDMGSAKRFNRWVVKNAGAAGESTEYNTYDYTITYSNNGTNFFMVDRVRYNAENITDRPLNRLIFKRYKKYAYDFMKMVSTFQGIVNRDGTKLFLKYEGSDEIARYWSFDPDTYWLEKLTQPGQILAGKKLVYVDDFYWLLDTFSDKITGLITWDDAVSSTSNAASTAAGVENLLPVRYDTGADSLYTEITDRTALPVAIDLNGKFTGSGTIWGTSTPSTGSKKNDAYIWAKENYLDTHKVSPDVMQFGVDAWLRDSGDGRDSSGNLFYDDLFNRMIINQDYYIKNKAFFFDLQPSGKYIPNDDPGQVMGTDYNTLEALLSSMESYAGGSIFTVGGFTAFGLKYSNIVPGNPGGMVPIDTEWDMTTMLSRHNGQLDADAPGLMGLANGSIYCQVPLNTLVQKNDKGAGNTESYDPNKRYLCFFMGDYDSGAWVAGELPCLWDSAGGRGGIPLAWPLAPNLARRVPMMFNYMYSTATSKDYFVAGDNGAGYLNTIDLPPQYYANFVNYTSNYFDVFDLDIAGFVINQWDPFLPKNLQDLYTQIAPKGVGTLGEADISDGVPFYPVNHSIRVANKNYLEKALIDMINKDPNAHFHYIRTVLADPVSVKEGALQFLANHPEMNAEVVDPYTFFRLAKSYYTTNIKNADFLTNGTNDETTTYLHDGSQSAIEDDRRFADMDGYFTYKFDIQDNVTSAKVLLDIGGDYVISGSTDNSAWTQLAAADHVASRGWITVDLSGLLSGNTSKTVYLKFTDQTANDGNGPSLWHLKLNTSYVVSADFAVDNGSAESLFLFKSYGNQQSWFKFADKKAFIEYKFNLMPNATTASLKTDMWGDYVISGSKDNVNWTRLASAGAYVPFEGRSWVNVDLTSLLSDNPTKTIYIKYSDRTTDDGNGPCIAHLSLNSDGYGASYRIKNVSTGEYMHVQNNTGKAEYGVIDPSWDSSKWMLEDAGSGAMKIKNVRTGKYLNIETDLTYVQCDENDWGDAAKWFPEDAGGGCTRFKNYWQKTYMHIEEKLGYVQCGSVPPDFDSSRWILEPVD